MRGDSVRDLYAKALALVGLGLLAGTGALVNYWPVQGALPSVAPGLSAASGATALDISHIQASNAVRVPRRVMASTPVSAREVAVTMPVFQTQAAFVEPTPVTAGVPVAVMSQPDEPMLVPVPVPPPPDSFGVTAAVVHQLDAPEVGLPSLPVSHSIEAVSTLVAVADRPITVSSSDNMFTGAAKKTGATVLAAGLKTGSVIGSSFRTIGHLFNKIL